MKFKIILLSMMLIFININTVFGATACDDTSLQFGFLFDEASGNASSCGGSITGTATDITYGLAGKFDDAFDFNGTTSKVTTNYTTNPSQRTAMFWVNLDGNGEGGLGRILEKNGDDIIYHANTTITYIKYFTTSYKVWSYNATPGTGVWFHFALTHDVSSSSNVPIFYINGNAVTPTESGSGSGSASTGTDPYVIGNNTAQSRTMDGRVDEIALFNEIKDKYFINYHMHKGLEYDVGSELVNYCADTNNKGCALMEDSGNETDRGLGDDYTETGGTIPQDTDRKFGDYSRDFELSDSEWLEQADGLATDIHGADQDLSIVFWMKTEGTTTVNSTGLVNKYNGIGNNRQYSVTLKNTKVVQVVLSSTGANYGVAYGVTNVVDQAWHHVAVVYNDTDIRIYIDGVLDSNGVNNPKAWTLGIYNGGAVFTIGTSLTVYFDGKIDDLGIFDRALTPFDVFDIYTRGLYQSSSPTADEIDAIFFGMEF